MPPRYQSTVLSFEEKARNLFDHFGQPAHRGHGRGPGSASTGSGLGQAPSLIQNPTRPPENDSAHLLVMSATGAAIASGGDHVTFDTLVAQHGFGSVLVQPGEGWVHPVAGVYELSYKHEWSAFSGGGTIRVELDGTLIPEGMILDGTVGSEGSGTLSYVADAGQVGRIHVVQSTGGDQACDAQVWVAIPDPRTAEAERYVSEIVCIADQGDPSSPWGAVPTGWGDPDACWVWHTALDGSGGRPDYEEAWIEGTYNSVSAQSVTVEFTADNLCSVSLNGALLGSDSDHTDAATSVSAVLKAGANLFECYAQNTVRSGGGAHPAGFLLTVYKTSTGEVLFHTTDQGGWVGHTAEPAGWTGP